MKNDKLNELSEKGKKALDQAKRTSQEKIEKLKHLKKDLVNKSR